MNQIKRYAYSRHYADQDYRSKLSKDELQWLDKFNNEYYFQAHYKEGTFFPSKEQHAELNAADYARRHDVSNTRLDGSADDLPEELLHQYIEAALEEPNHIKQFKATSLADAVEVLIKEKTELLLGCNASENVERELIDFLRQYGILRSLESTTQ